jgi:transketolase
MAASGTKVFREAYPDRLIDVGVAEANMMGVAAGLAAMGKIPFANTFAPFAARRACDQVTLSIAYAKQNVKICGTDPGLTAELNGGTHMGIEDAGIMRGIATMVVFEPTDSFMVEKALPQIVRHNGPVYIRLFRKSSDALYDSDLEFDLFKSIKVKEGGDVTIIACGIMVYEALKAAQLLEEEGISAAVIDMHTIKPIDKTAIIEAAKSTGGIVTAENHSIYNGLGSAVAEVLAENFPVPMQRIGIADMFGEVGKLPYLLERFGMRAEDIAAACKKVMARKNSQQKAAR